jgi:hypothetical protein
MEKSRFTDNERFRALSILAKHIGRQKALAMPLFYEQVFNEHPATAISGTRKLRSLVTELRRQGEPICSTTSGGYYLAAAGSELDDYCQSLKNQAIRKLLIVSRIKKTSFNALCMQLELDFGDLSPVEHKA